MKWISGNKSSVYGIGHICITVLAEHEAITLQEPITDAGVAGEVVAVQTMKLHERM